MDMVFTGAAAPNPSELLSDMMFEQFLQVEISISCDDGTTIGREVKV